MIKAFIFDLDGTLIDSESLWCEAVRRVIESRGQPVTETYASELVFGRAWGDIQARLYADYPVFREEPCNLELESFAHYESLRGAADIRIPSSIALLERLSGRYPVAIVSGSTRRQIGESVAMMGIGHCLRFYLGSEDYPRGKPDPAGFLMAARRFDVKPGECLVFEDSPAGVRAAHLAGMRCIALRRHGAGAPDLAGADEVLGDLADFRPERYGILC